MREEAGAEIAKVSVYQELSKEDDSRANNPDQTSALTVPPSVVLPQSELKTLLLSAKAGKVSQRFIIPGVSLR